MQVGEFEVRTALNTIPSEKGDNIKMLLKLWRACTEFFLSSGRFLHRRSCSHVADSQSLKKMSARYSTATNFSIPKTADLRQEHNNSI